MSRDFVEESSVLYRPHAAAALTAAEYRALVDFSPVMIWRAGTDALCDYFNDGWLAFTGRTLEQEVGNGWADGVHPDDLRRCLEHYLDAFSKRKAFEMSYRLRRADGAYRWVLDRGTPYFDSGGLFHGFIGSCVDVDDSRRVLTMGELAVSIAHDIRQPITAAMMSAEVSARLLGQRDPDVQRARDAVIDAATEVKRASDIIDRVRSLYSHSAPRQDQLDLNELVRDVVTLVAREAAPNDVDIRTDLDDSVGSIVADRVQLQQVLLNLMLNASEAMKESPGAIVVTSRRSGMNEVSIAVSDTGVGLPSAGADRIFDAFFTTKPHGTGMGLAISRAIVESHGGELWVTPNRDRGVTFQFTLPGGERTRRR